MKRFIRRAILLGLAAVVLVAVIVALLPAPIEADSATARLGTMRVTVEEEGETRCRTRYVVAAPVAGRLERVGLDEGQNVARGQIVARLYPPPIDTRQLEVAKAAVAAAESSLSEAEANVGVVRAEAEQAARTRDRAERLVEDGLISREQYEIAATAERTASESVDAAIARVERSRAEVRQARSALIAAGADTRSTPVAMRSPSDGVVLRVFEESERIVAQGTPILEIGDVEDLEVVVDVLSSDAALIGTGTEAELSGWGVAPRPGIVRMVEPAGFTKVSALGVEEQRVNVLIDFKEPVSDVRAGYRVLASIVVWTGEHVLKAPTGALVRSGENWGVFTIVDGRARFRIVEVGHRTQQEVEILSGLTEGEKLIVHPPNDLYDGSRVNANDR